MSVFPRIAPDHPLSEAARAVNAYSEEHGIDETLDWLGMQLGAAELAYLGEQRALRAVAAATVGLNMGGDRVVDEVAAAAIVGTPLWRDMRMLLVSCYMDAFVIGWRARMLQEQDQER